MPQVDFIITGGGAAGLSLVIEILRSDLKDRSVLIIDRDRKTQNDRTWCFWSDHPTGLEPIIQHTWHQIRFINQRYNAMLPLDNYRYHKIRGIDFYNFARAMINRHPNVSFLQGDVEALRDIQEGASVFVNGTEYQANFVFDSILKPADFRPDPTRYHYLKQHFLGWEIETPTPIFDPETPTLFDFRTPQNHAMRFMYILPESPTRALVEYTLFSPALLTMEEYESALRNYLSATLMLSSFRILDVEHGSIPMSDHPLPRVGGKHILNIGTKGGQVKPSSGYAFWRIQEDSRAIVRSMLQHNHPFDIPLSSSRYRLFDSLILQIMLRHPDDCAAIFTAMFSHNPVPRILRFLDEKGSLWNDLSLLASLPPLRFVEALVRRIGGSPP
jgi:lycopene beta-cyclase